ncbi:MAG: hypothetical protein IIA10_03785 [Proteobacteria bacterium]|nr:hypothetical protein [Pseudomonadota bacterium]
MNHRKGRLIFAAVAGIVVALLSYRWIIDPAPKMERERQELAVAESRRVLADALSIGDLELVDALTPNRRVGKVYIYPIADGWEISGYYRRDENDRWHPYLMSLSQSLALETIKVRDTEIALVERAEKNPKLSVTP